MKKVVFIVEKTGTGFSAYSNDFDTYPVGTTGGNTQELKSNILEAINLYQEHTNAPAFSAGDITLSYDLPQFFEFYKEINASALGKRIGMNKALLSEYINGKRTPSEKQTQRIFEGIKALGRELVELELV
jgi:transcriptional regulator with XRE-family HTH domain